MSRTPSPAAGASAAPRCWRVAAACARLIVVTMATGIAGCAPTGPAAVSPQEIRSPAGPHSGQPHLAVTGDGRLLMSWVEAHEPSGHRLLFAEARGGNWSEPRTIAEGDDWFVNWADVPAIVALSNGTLAAHWLEKSGSGTYAYDVRVRISHDGGDTWSQPVTPHRDGTETEHGFVSFFESPGGELGLVWLDGRDFASHGHGVGIEGMKGEMSLRAAFIGSGGAPGPEMVIDGRVCECCPTAAARTDTGILVAYRDRSPDEIRDIGLARYEDGRWSEPYAAHRDNWRIPGCPVNGPALASKGRDVVLAWFAAPDNDARVSAAFSHDGGLTFGDAIRIDEGTPLGRVATALLPDGSALVSWIEYVGGAADIRVRRIHADGTAESSVLVSATGADRASGYPRMAHAGNRIFFAWTATGGDAPRVRTAVTLLP